MTDESPQNPYKSPATYDDPSPVRRPDIPTIISIFILSLVAAAGAFFATCFGAVFVSMGLGLVTLDSGPSYWGVVVLLICTIAAIVAAVRVFRWRYRKETGTGTVFKDKARRQ